MTSNNDKLNEFITNEFAANAGLPLPEKDEPLLSSAGGVVDSLGLQKLIVFLESEIGIEVRDEDIVPETFETLAALHSYMEMRTADLAKDPS